MSSNVPKCLFPGLTTGNQWTAPLTPSNPALPFNTSCHRKLEKYECPKNYIHKVLEVLMKNNMLDGNLGPLVENVSFKLITLYC